MASYTKRARRALRRSTSAGLRKLSSILPVSWQERVKPHVRYTDMLLFDHLFIRFVFPNRHRLSDEAWRAAQPLPYQIRNAARHGIRTIVNLRGQVDTSTYHIEEKACREAGIALRNFKIRSRAAPTREEVLAAREMFQSVEYPILMHCKSGADRVGLMSALYLHTRQGVPIEQARRQLSLAYGHIRQADTGVLDHFLEAYLDYAAKTHIAFFDWVETVYDPDEVTRRVHARRWANRIVDKVFRRE